MGQSESPPNNHNMQSDFNYIYPSFAYSVWLCCRPFVIEVRKNLVLSAKNKKVCSLVGFKMVLCFIYNISIPIYINIK